ncbi:nuclear transport factor 2 family protein [Tateyamaria pelophila]|uniref:nuclear transport factor 2 family protein n=1 Tax=Tateyamaria pelophila TaxID=328415 RepID=UPI001CBB657F|nr:nuclear transport factor 2 family protein [Tateyamaria pelophila]
MDLTETLKAYAAAWGEADAGRRSELLEACWADDAVYADPMARIQGRAAFVDHIGGVQTQFPGSRIKVTSGVDMHHNSLRFEWRLQLADGSTAIEGIDFATLADDGRLSSITGFFGPIPAAS